MRQDEQDKTEVAEDSAPDESAKETTPDDGKHTRKNDGVSVNKLTPAFTRVVYWVFEVLMLGTMIASIVQLCVVDTKPARTAQVTHIVLCAVALVLYNIPSFVQRKFRIYVPSVLHIFVLVFIYAHFILGEIQGFYTQSAVFDKILHTTSGCAIALGGFSLVDFLNRSPNAHMKLNPFFVAVFSFCFALAIAVLWEIFEYCADCWVGTNMQRYIPPAGLEKAEPPKQGYGLVDTMGDVIVSTLSAFVVCVLGYIVLKRKKNYLNRFLLRKIPDYDTAIAQAEEAGDEKLVAALKKARAAAIEEIDSDKHAEDETAESPQSETADETQETAGETKEPSQSGQSRVVAESDGESPDTEKENDDREQSDVAQK